MSSAVLLTYSYAQKHHNNCNKFYNNYPMNVGKWSEDEHRKDKVDGYRQHPRQREVVNNVLMENGEYCVYLGQQYTLKEKRQDNKIRRRTMIGWAAYTKNRDHFNSRLP